MSFTVDNSTNSLVDLVFSTHADLDWICEIVFEILVVVDWSAHGYESVQGEEDESELGSEGGQVAHPLAHLTRQVAAGEQFRQVPVHESKQGNQSELCTLYYNTSSYIQFFNKW